MIKLVLTAALWLPITAKAEVPTCKSIAETFLQEMKNSNMLILEPQEVEGQFVSVMFVDAEQSVVAQLMLIVDKKYVQYPEGFEVTEHGRCTFSNGQEWDYLKGHNFIKKEKGI